MSNIYMTLVKKMQKPSGKIIMSILLGIGLATLFRSVCNDESCIEYVAAQPKDFKDKIIKNKGKCYSYKMETTKCVSDKSQKILQFD